MKPRNLELRECYGIHGVETGIISQEMIPVSVFNPIPLLLNDLAGYLLCRPHRTSSQPCLADTTEASCCDSPHRDALLLSLTLLLMIVLS